ncbi:Zinc finger protein [Halotydeus destructor]|nr:Zinc finger protein [Halotydeus destructor]
MSSIKTLYLPEKSSVDEAKADEALIVCPLCDLTFEHDKKTSHDVLVKEVNSHLVKEHSLVIANFHDVVDVGRYLRYWKDKFVTMPITEYCSIIKTNCGQDDLEQSEDYYILSPDVLPEDNKLRQQLSIDRLSRVLADQELERSDTTFKRRCLFCKKVFKKNRTNLLDHLLHDHNFSVGLPDNIVYISELLDLIEVKLEKRLCLYCEKTFTSWDVLKEHMRKKQHKLLNPENKEYDRFYLINYLEPGKDWRNLVGDERGEREFQDDHEWEDWKEDAKLTITCLFCEKSYETFDELKQHIKTIHNLNFDHLLSWPFYKKVKFVNYVRRCTHLAKCFYCQQSFSDVSQLYCHLTASDHCSLIPDETLWDATEYFFPTYENDELLHNLEDNEDDLNEEVTIIPEESKVESS